MTILVAGSGPAGAFAALGALEAGAKVLMLDPGKTAEPEVLAFKAHLAGRHWKEWSERERAQFGASMATLSQKRFLGSAFASEKNDSIRQKQCLLLWSQARGGLSNLWGRGIEPPYAGECDHWPFKDEFFAAMRSVLSHLPFCGEEDNLARVMPLFRAPSPHPVTHASEALLDYWQAHEAALNQDGIHFGKTRLALRTGEQGCRLCGLCFYGCVYDAMFETGEMVETLARFPSFEYRAGYAVERFESVGSGISVIARHLATEKGETFKVEKCILAAGAPATSLIVMKSLSIPTARLKSSELVKFAFLRLGKAAPEKTEYHALSQLTLAINRRDMTRRAMVMHLFGKNPMIADTMLSRIPPAIGKRLTPLFDRLIIGMCFLHSDDSDPIEIALKGKDAHFTGKRSPRGLTVYLKLLWFFLSRISKTGLLPIPFVGGISLPGSSVHYGGSFAHGAACDQNGELGAAKNVYVADAAALPDIPAGSYTLSIMANAYRIGKTSVT